jgi:hypothetical protein
MNNKVLELLQQSVTEYKQNWDISEDSTPCIPQEIIDRFAKLIIRECINEVSLYHSATIHDGFIPENPTREHYEELAYIKGNNAGYNDAVKQITDGLKKYFGVE